MLKNIKVWSVSVSGSGVQDSQDSKSRPRRTIEVHIRFTANAKGYKYKGTQEFLLTVFQDFEDFIIVQ
jgi:hypothetical protein